MNVKGVRSISFILAVILLLVTACGDTSIPSQNTSSSEHGRKPLGRNEWGMKIHALSLDELKEPSNDGEGVFIHGGMAGQGTFYIDLHNGSTLQYEGIFTNQNIPAPYTPLKTTVTFCDNTQNSQVTPLKVEEEYGAFEIAKVYETPRYLLISGHFRDGKWRIFHAVYLVDMQTKDMIFLNEVLNRNSVRIRNCFPGYVEVEVEDIPGWQTIDRSPQDKEILFYRIVFDEKTESRQTMTAANKYHFRKLLVQYADQGEQLACSYWDSPEEKIEIRNQGAIETIITYLDSFDLYKIIKNNDDNLYQDRIMAFYNKAGEEILIGSIGKDILTISLVDNFFVKEFHAYKTNTPIDAGYIKKLLKDKR
ncbi:hypothetical protein HNQ80_001273 [Anaerosolibacter carboniphilus]|uniref:Lipoprotein n=1 Tax=Anaerosolibacter carboniphilus TaxID=1417629 RepID=A0A841KN00_9FIRM|nr:hypothetical protein [Anaerosolibacter carboniphilus]MBB6215184.1 hypothetical protein [Anaerosolibacter carboniphilus]